MDIGTWFTITNTTLGIGTLLLVVFGIALLVPRIAERIPARVIVFSQILIAVMAFVMPLTYQYLFGFPPCFWCWIQRILMWPILFIFPYAYVMREHSTIARYLIPLTVTGMIVAGYHYSLQWGIAPESGICNTVGQSVSCGGIEVLVFGFITIPLMSFVAFAVQFLLLRKMK